MKHRIRKFVLGLLAAVALVANARAPLSRALQEGGGRQDQEDPEGFAGRDCRRKHPGDRGPAREAAPRRRRAPHVTGPLPGVRCSTAQPGKVLLCVRKSGVVRGPESSCNLQLRLYSARHDQETSCPTASGTSGPLPGRSPGRPAAVWQDHPRPVPRRRRTSIWNRNQTAYGSTSSGKRWRKARNSSSWTRPNRGPRSSRAFAAPSTRPGPAKAAFSSWGPFPPLS